MRSLPQFNFPAFDAASERWRSQGYYVYSPADHDRANGFDEFTLAEPTHEQLTEMISWDLDAVIKSDIIYFLRGWERSSGAKVEHALAVFLGKEIRYE
jgi:hypothetical protein